MAHHKTLSIVIGLPIVVAMLFGAILFAVGPLRTEIASAGQSVLAQVRAHSADQTFGPLIVYAREPQASRP
jgi:hypothetical protein